MCACGAVRDSQCPVPRSAATWSDALPTTASSQPNSSSTPHPAVPFKVKTPTVSGPQEALKPKLKCAWKIFIWCLWSVPSYYTLKKLEPGEQTEHRSNIRREGGLNSVLNYLCWKEPLIPKSFIIIQEKQGRCQSNLHSFPQKTMASDI